MSAALKAVDPRRRSLLAKVHIAKKEMGLDDLTYRDMLERVTGRRSASEATDDKLVAFLEAAKVQGWAKPAAPARAVKAADHPVAKKARALWISLHQLGVVKEPSEKALEAFARRQLKVEKLQWADQAQGYRLIEALKAMALRGGWDTAVTTEAAARDGEVKALKIALVKAQWGRLDLPHGAPPVCSGLAEWAWRRRITQCVRSVETFTVEELEACAQQLGPWVRNVVESPNS